MPILALALFGSRARGDHNASSDTDILVVTDEHEVRVNTMASVSLSIYPREDLIQRSRLGDLFTGHLVVDAIPLLDPTQFLAELRLNWRPKSSYALEIKQASDLAMFLVRHHELLRAPSLVSRRVAWCVRTILIARSVEAGAPRYSAHDLSAFSGDSRAYGLLALKDKSHIDPFTMSNLAAFVHHWGHVDLLQDQSFGGFIDEFTRSGNSLALKTIGVTAEHGDDY